jgi:hypothetical protein
MQKIYTVQGLRNRINKCKHKREVVNSILHQGAVIFIIITILTNIEKERLDNSA